MSTRLVLMALIAVIAGCAPLKEGSEQPVPAPATDRVVSSNGFSFLPPQGSAWTEEFGQHQILYVKKTGSEGVSFYTGAIEGSLSTTLADEQALIEFVRTKKEDWGGDARYFDSASNFHIEEPQQTCVRYSSSAKDRGAKNKGGHDFSVMMAVGKFCLHPESQAAAVDIFYSVRYVPQHDPSRLIAEGEEFLSSLQFEPLPYRT